MSKFLIRRTFSLLLTMAFVSVVVFFLTEIAPGNIAINTLGNNISPDQEKSFNKQNGLDQPAVARYLRWLIGSDWQAAQNIGRPVSRVYDAANDRYGWWEQMPDGALAQFYSPDGSQMVERIRQPDGTAQEQLLADTVWKPDPADSNRLVNATAVNWTPWSVL